MQARSRAAAASVAVSYRHTSRHRTEHATGGLLKKWGPALGVGKKKVCRAEWLAQNVFWVEFQYWVMA